MSRANPGPGQRRNVEVVKTRVTVDTNVFGEAKMARMSKASDGWDIALAPTTVSLRERPLETSDPRWIVTETAVWNESRWGEAIWGEPVDETLS